MHKYTNTQMQRALQNGRGDVEAPPRGTLMWQVCDFVRWVGAWQVWPIGGNSFQRCWAFCVFVYFLFVYLCIWQVEIAFRHVEPSHQVALWDPARWWQSTFVKTIGYILIVWKSITKIPFVSPQNFHHCSPLPSCHSWQKFSLYSKCSSFFARDWLLTGQELACSKITCLGST